MCYVVAKNANKIGSVAIRMKLGKAVVQLKEEMNDQYLSKHIQFVTISRPSADGKYSCTRDAFVRFAVVSTLSRFTLSALNTPDTSVPCVNCERF